VIQWPNLLWISSKEQKSGFPVIPPSYCEEDNHCVIFSPPLCTYSFTSLTQMLCFECILFSVW
jgi:hypothetical protein